MRNSDVVAGLAIVFGTVLGAHFSQHLNSSETLHPVPHIHVVEVASEAPEVAKTPVQLERERRVVLRVSSVDPRRQAHLQIEMNGHPVGATTDVVTPFTLISTKKSLEGYLTTRVGDPEVRVELEGLTPGTLTPVSAAATGRRFVMESGNGLRVQALDEGR